MEDWELYGFIKEEENKYYLRNLAGEEGLVYDFTVNTGDTITIDNPFGFIPYEAIVTSIDSVFIEPANEYRKQITLFDYLNYGYEESWIEGIGSLAGITESGWDMTILTGANDFTLLCYYENATLWYKTDLYLLCFYPLVGVASNNYESVKTFLIPNPVKDISTLYLDASNQKHLTVKIIDLRGKIIEYFHISYPAAVRINSRKLNKGLYIYQVFEESVIMASGKFVVL
jgi:hypothetical protein